MQAANSETLREKLTRVNAELRAAGRPDSFYQSLEAAWNRYGSLTERQEAALVRSFAQREERAAARAQEATQVTSPMPTGRVTITGEILSTKWQENRFSRGAGCLKMLVRSEAGWKVWGTVPASIEYDGGNELKGRRVTFTAKVEPKEAAFGFFSRPTNASLLPLDAPHHQSPAAPVAAPAFTPAPSGRIARNAREAARINQPAAPAGKLADIIAKAKELEERKERISGYLPTRDWDTDSMSEAA